MPKAKTKIKSKFILNNMKNSYKKVESQQVKTYRERFSHACTSLLCVVHALKKNHALLSKCLGYYCLKRRVVTVLFKSD